MRLAVLDAPCSAAQAIDVTTHPTAGFFTRAPIRVCQANRKNSSGMHAAIAVCTRPDSDPARDTWLVPMSASCGPISRS